MSPVISLALNAFTVEHLINIQEWVPDPLRIPPYYVTVTPSAVRSDSCYVAGRALAGGAWTGLVRAPAPIDVKINFAINCFVFLRRSVVMVLLVAEIYVSL